MLRHIVLFKIRPEFRADIPALVKGFYEMVGQVPGMVSLEAGADVLGSDRSCDVALVVTFTDRAALDAYQDHPAHLPVKKRMHQVRESSVACDFLID
ncbi:MAG: Dabb family protein [Clostridiales bacterium]|nr:Dabb family protein [Clostridiales bacterium]